MHVSVCCHHCSVGAVAALAAFCNCAAQHNVQRLHQNIELSRTAAEHRSAVVSAQTTLHNAQEALEHSLVAKQAYDNACGQLTEQSPTVDQCRSDVDIAQAALQDAEEALHNSSGLVAFKRRGVRCASDQKQVACMAKDVVQATDDTGGCASVLAGRRLAREAALQPTARDHVNPSSWGQCLAM